MSAPAVYLASKSPRREELLRQLGIEFVSLRLREAPGRERDIAEEARHAEPAHHYVERIARTKAAMGWQKMLQRGLSHRPVLGADTEVVLDGAIFGKPSDAADAARMLALLSSRTHQVLTAVALCWEQQTMWRSPRRRSRFAIFPTRRSSATSPPGNLSTRRAPTPFRDAPLHGSPASKEAIRASWACRSMRPPKRSPAWASPCYKKPIAVYRAACNSRGRTRIPTLIILSHRCRMKYLST